MQLDIVDSKDRECGMVESESFLDSTRRMVVSRQKCRARFDEANRPQNMVSNKSGALQGLLRKTRSFRLFGHILADDVAFEIDGIADLL